MSSPSSLSSTSKILRTRKPGLDMTELVQGGVREFHINLSPLAGECFLQILPRLKHVLSECGATIVKLDFFAPAQGYKSALQILHDNFGEISWPVTWADGGGCADRPIGGIQVLAISGATVEPVRLENRIIGAIYQDAFARHYLLGDLRPADPTESRSVQTSRAYEQLEKALALKGMSMFNIVRTWFFLRDILAWYDDFNLVRTKFYQERKLIDRFVPASTGVGTNNPFGTALVLGAWAIERLNDDTRINMLPSPLQCPAPAYGSCFSRAAEIVTPSFRHVLVSGTASIHPPGDSAHAGDMLKQVNLTMKVIEAILSTRKLSFADTTRATAYIKNPADAPVFAQWREQNKTRFPVHVVHADICRAELLFELEVDLIAETNRG
jgi:enamine deaminase RidA (YjgF/YER057c/UK114 family)